MKVPSSFISDLAVSPICRWHFFRIAMVGIAIVATDSTKGAETMLTLPVSR